jgi:hypothetical protein
MGMRYDRKYKNFVLIIKQIVVGLGQVTTIRGGFPPTPYFFTNEKLPRLSGPYKECINKKI